MILNWPLKKQDYRDITISEEQADASVDIVIT